MGNFNFNPSRKPSEEKRSVVSNYQQEDHSVQISRENVEREILVGILKKGKLSHTTMLFAYFANVTSAGSSGLCMRLYFVELFIDSATGENVLSMKGPALQIRPSHKCEKFYLVKSSITRLKELARYTMSSHGEYSMVSNNCRHFTAKYFEVIKEKSSVLGVKVTWKQVTDYISKFPPSINPTAVPMKGGTSLTGESSAAGTVSFLEFLSAQKAGTENNGRASSPGNSMPGNAESTESEEVPQPVNIPQWPDHHLVAAEESNENDFFMRSLGIGGENPENTSPQLGRKEPQAQAPLVVRTSPEVPDVEAWMNDFAEGK